VTEDDDPAPARRGEVAGRYRQMFGSGDSMDRMVFFSDAVFAIAMTVLVLDLIIPEGLELEDLQTALVEAVPEFFAYALSFAVLAGAWLNHHRRFTVIRRFDSRLQWLNLLLLFFIAMLPMPTSFLSNYGSLLPWPPVLYAVVTSAVYLTLNAIWAHAWHAGLMDPVVDRAMYRYSFENLLPVPVVFLASVPLAFWSPAAAMYMWLLLIPAGFVTGRLSRRT
jgi:uncharacterized membrane protein